MHKEFSKYFLERQRMLPYTGLLPEAHNGQKWATPKQRNGNIIQVFHVGVKNPGTIVPWVVVAGRWK